MSEQNPEQLNHSPEKANGVDELVQQEHYDVLGNDGISHALVTIITKNV